MIRVVAVLETIMLSDRGRGHEGEQHLRRACRRRAMTMASARRRWRPVRSIASAMIAPPSTRNRIGE